MEPDAISESALVGLVDRLKRPTRRSWADKGLLNKTPREEGYKEEDAAELAAFVQLTRAEIGDFYETAAAWRGIRQGLGEVLSKDHPTVGADELIAVIDVDTKEGALITRKEELGQLVLGDKRERHVIRTVDLSEVVRAAREGFRRLVDARHPSAPRD
jgi:hypothetical protein